MAINHTTPTFPGAFTPVTPQQSACARSGAATRRPGRRGFGISAVLEGSIEIAGALTGGLLGTLGGVPGDLGGDAVGVAVTRALKAAVGNRLKSRANLRAGAAALVVKDELERRSREGGTPRGDGFFTSDGRVRPEAESLLEGVLRAAQAAYDERKVTPLASFYAAVAHDEATAAAQAHFLLRTITELTFGQLEALAVFARHEEHIGELLEAGRGQVLTGGPDLRDPDPTIQLELADLADRNLLGAISDNGSTPAALGTIWGGARTAAAAGYGKLRLLPAGEQLATLACLGRWITPEDRRAWIERLRGTPRSSREDVA